MTVMTKYQLEYVADTNFGGLNRMVRRYMSTMKTTFKYSGRWPRVLSTRRHEQLWTQCPSTDQGSGVYWERNAALNICVDLFEFKQTACYIEE